MTSPRRAILAAGLAAMTGMTGCGGFLNPALLGGTGGNPVASASDLNGFVIVTLANLTTGAVSLDFTADIRPPGADEARPETSNQSIGIPGYFAMTLPCGVEQIRLETLTAFIDGEEIDVPLPTTLLPAGSVPCGSIVLVSVQLTQAGGITADVQVIR